MYFVITYESSNKDDAIEHNFKEEVKSKLQGKIWVRPLSKVFIIQSSDENFRTKLSNHLLNYLKVNDIKIRFFITPLISSAEIRAFVPTDLIPHIKKTIAHQQTNWENDII